MSDPRMIPADEAKRLREAATDGPWRWRTGERVAYRHELIGADDPAILACGALRWPDEPDADLIAAAPDLAHTVVEQAAQVERVREALHRIEGAQARASEDWHRTLDPRAQHEMIAHQRDADWLRTATGDNDD